MRNRARDEITPLSAYKYLRQLLFLKKEEDWKWQLEGWQKVFGREFYTPRLCVLADFLYSKSSEYITYTEFFKWSDYTLEVNISTGGIKAISFDSNKGLGMCYLMDAFIRCLRLCGKRENGWLEVYADRDFLRKHIEKFFNKKGIDDNWIKNTKGNLVKKIPDDWKGRLINIGDFDRRKGGYYFALKIPF